jgi:uncharacterized RmlC-like cupin family protein
VETTKVGYDAIRVVRGDEVSSGATGQTYGMTRYEAISGRSVGAQRLWMGRSVAPPGLVTTAHHHGESESALYVARGTPTFLFGPELRQRVDVAAGDFLFIPPYAVHVEANLGDVDVEFIVVRSSQEAIVVNLPDHTIPPGVLGTTG